MSDVLEVNSRYAVEPAKRLSHKDVEELNQLLDQLSPNDKKGTHERMNCALMCGQGQDLLLAYDRKTEKIIGMLSLIRIPRLRRETGLIEDVVVDKDHRRMGIGQALVQEALSIAKRRGMVSVRLTCPTSRNTAQKFYKALGFRKRDTEVFHMDLK